MDRKKETLTVNFQLKEPNNKAKMAIRMRVYYNTKTFTWYLKDNLGKSMQIYPHLWDSNHQGSKKIITKG